MLNHQGIRFGLVGLIATGTHMGVLVLCVEWLGWAPLPSSILGFIAAVLDSYFLNYYWTFKTCHGHSRTFLRYLAVTLIGLALNTAIMSALLNLLHWWYLWAQLAVLLVVPLSNYLLNRYWTFNANSAKGQTP